MPPRFAYWTIILEGKPTAFRAQQRDDLLPTLRQLQSRHPDVQMKWFARGRIWTSPEEAQQHQRREGERRSPEWRPGGEHRDPRARFEVPRKERRRRFARELRRESATTDPTGRPGRPHDSRPPAGKPFGRGPERPRDRSQHPTSAAGTRRDSGSHLDGERRREGGAQREGGRRREGVSRRESGPRPKVGAPREGDPRREGSAPREGGPRRDRTPHHRSGPRSGGQPGGRGRPGGGRGRGNR